MNIDEIVSRIGTGTIIPESSPVDLEHELSNIENHRGNFLFEPLIRAFLNFLLRNGGDIDPALNPATKLADVIIHDRNHHIVETLRSSDQKRIVLVYGALHFEGIYAGLQTLDPKWKILSIEPFYPYAY